MAGKNAIGLDIGSSSIKVIHLKEDRKGVHLQGFDVQMLPPEAVVDGALMNFTAITEKVRELVAANRLRTKDVCVSVSGHSVIIKKISLPEMTPDELAVSFPIPDDQDLAENGSGAVQVVAPSGALLGGTVASDINNAGDGFEATVQWLSPTSTELRTRYLVFIEDGPVTLVTTDGGPIANAGTLDFVATPYLTDAGAPHGLHDSLSWSLSDGDTPDSVIMTVFDDEGGLGNVIVPANAPSVRVPELPDSSDADAHFDGVDLQAVVFSCGFVMGEGCTRFSRDELITLEP